MKIKYLFMSALACGLLGTCSNDEVVENSDNNFNGGEAYVKVRIAMSDGAGTRATSGGYDNGTAEEQAIKSIRFAFYDDAGNFVAYGREVGATSVTPTNPDQNVEGMAEAVVALEIAQGQELPTQVLAVVNATPVELQTSNYSAIRALETSSVGDVNNGFVMTNSSYWNGEETTLTAVSAGDFYETEAMATAAENPVTIYVERLAAKVAMTEATSLPENIEELTDSEGHVLAFTLEGYALTGLNSTEYYIKHLQDWSAFEWTWNNASDYRSYWAEDPNYSSVSAGDLSFISYDDVIANNKATQYCPENTFASTLYDTHNFQACTSVLVVGSYAVTDAEGESVADADGTFYMYGGIAYSETNLLNRLANNGLVFTRSGAGTSEDPHVYTSADPTAYALVKLATSEAGNEVTLSLTQGETTYYTPGAEGGYTEITDYAAFNATLAAHVGGAEKYTEGKAFFAVPIEHLNPTPGDGQYGVVRNHSYQLTLQSIRGMGDGVFDPTEDIIPTPPTNKYYVGATLNILSWHVVNQDVNL